MYKRTDQEKIDSAVMEESVEKMIQQLVEDRHKQEEEFALERAADEEAAEKRVQEMQKQVDTLMKLVSKSTKAKAAAATPLGHGPQVHETGATQEDIEAYLVTFERIMEAYN